MIPTYDAISLIAKHLSQKTVKYPEGSLSRREILITIKVEDDQEAQIKKINSLITRALYNKISEISQRMFKDKLKSSSALDKSSADELTQEVLRSISLDLDHR